MKTFFLQFASVMLNALYAPAQETAGTVDRTTTAIIHDHHVAPHIFRGRYREETTSSRVMFVEHQHLRGSIMDEDGSSYNSKDIGTGDSGAASTLYSGNDNEIKTLKQRKLGMFDLDQGDTEQPVAKRGLGRANKRGIITWNKAANQVDREKKNLFSGTVTMCSRPQDRRERCRANGRKIWVCHDQGGGKFKPLCIAEKIVPSHLKYHRNDSCGKCIDASTASTQPSLTTSTKATEGTTTQASSTSPGTTPQDFTTTTTATTVTSTTTSTSPTITITHPPPNHTTKNHVITIEGNIEPYISGTVSSLCNVASIFPGISTTGHFRLQVFLPEGTSQINVIATADDGSNIGDASIQVMYTRPSEFSGIIEKSNGGEVEVSDPDSAINGAMIQVQPGFATRDFMSHIVYDPEHVPLLPYKYVAIGLPVLFTPEGEAFDGLVALTVPMDMTMVPSLANLTSIQVLSLTENDWESVSSSPILNTSLLTFQVTSLGIGPFLAVVEVPLEEDQVMIETNPEGSTIHIDGIDSGLVTPAVVSGINPQITDHVARLYLDGYNEVFFSFRSASRRALSKSIWNHEPPAEANTSLKPITAAAFSNQIFASLTASQETAFVGNHIKIDLVHPVSPIPDVVLRSHFDGLSVASSLLDIVADTKGIPLDEGAVGIISVNGRDQSATVTSGTVTSGEIRGFVSLEMGFNHVNVRANGLNGTTGSSPVAIIKREIDFGRRKRKLISGEIIITLVWDTFGTDIDLHIFDPLGNHAYYSNSDGIPGGEIDVDATDGYGPEIFTYSEPIPGMYRVAVDSYSIGEAATTATVRVTVGGNEVFLGSYRFTSDDDDATDGDPSGADPAAFWDTTTFIIGDLDQDLIITKVWTRQGSLDGRAIFTTAQGENEIFITTQAPPEIDNSSISYEIGETEEGYEVDSLLTFGRDTSFIAKHAPYDTTKSHALRFKIIAYTLENGERSLESLPAYIEQDVRSQIRQEYIDKRDEDISFVRAIPPRDQILTQAEFTQASPFFSFQELAEYSDYYPPLSVIGHSVHIANTLRTYWGKPLICTSAWRNPRRNDRIGGVLNSYHQSGDAVDIRPSYDSTKWPINIPGCCTGIDDFETALQALSCLAYQIFDATVYDIVDEYNYHLHIEREVSDDAAGDENDGVEESSVMYLERGALTILGEGITSYVYWPKTAASGVTLGIGYDMGSRDSAGVVSDLVAAGMDQEQAQVIAEGSELKGYAAQAWIEENKERVGLIDEEIIRGLFASQFPEYTQKAKVLATDTEPSPGLHAINARSRELSADPPRPLYTYVMKEDQWANLHPAMIEFITDLKFHGGFYAYNRIALINELLITHYGDHLEQFKQVATLFGSPPTSSLSHMDEYAMAPPNGSTGGNTETFYGVSADDIQGATERRTRTRLSYLFKVTKALEVGSTVTIIDPTITVAPADCVADNPHVPSTCSPGPNGCFTPRALFVRGAIVACFPSSQKAPTTYFGHSGYGNSMDAWPAAGGYKIHATGQLKVDMDSLALWLMENHDDLKLYYMIWYNRIWNPSRDAFGEWWDCDTAVPGTNPPQYRCACMSSGSCGDVTQGHFDHLHITVLY